MADSISTQESCVCVFAHGGIPLRRQPTPDHFFIQVMLSMSVVSDIPRTPRIPFSSTVNWTTRKLLECPRQAFLSDDLNEQHEIINKMVETLKIPFPLENNVHWSAVQYCPTESQKETLEQIKSRLVCIARDQARKDESKGHMGITIRKVDRLSPDKYREFCAERERQQRGRRNRRNWCAWFTGMLTMLSPEDNRCFGLELVKVEDEDDCSICCCSLLKKDSRAMRMPCSHIFHKHCISSWILRRPTCPLCRFELLSPDQWSSFLRFFLTYYQRPN